jgi:ribosomal protein S27AE
VTEDDFLEELDIACPNCGFPMTNNDDTRVCEDCGYSEGND